MARVAMVEPVVVIADVVGAAFALHAEHVCLACIPVAVVAHGDILRVALHIDGSVALGVVAATVRTVEHVHVVNPDIAIVGIERQTIVETAHDAEVAELDALGVAHKETETLDGCIVANALEGHVQLRVSTTAFHLDAFLLAANGIEVGPGDESDEAEGDGCLVLSFLVCFDDGLQAHARIRLGAGNVGADGLGAVLRDIEHLGACLQRAVVVVGSHAAVVVEMGIARTVIGFHLDV